MGAFTGRSAACTPDAASNAAKELGLLSLEEGQLFLVQLPAVLNARPDAPRAGERLSLQVAGVRGDAAIWHFDNQGLETLAGAEHAVRIIEAELNSSFTAAWQDLQTRHSASACAANEASTQAAIAKAVVDLAATGVREPEQHGLPRCRRQPVLAGFAQDRRPIGIRQDQPGILGHDLGGNMVGDGEEQPVAMEPVVRPLRVGAEIVDARLDFDDPERPIRRERHDIGPATGRQRQLRDGREAEAAEPDADAFESS